MSNAVAMRELGNLHYSEPVPAALLCLLCHQVFDEPVIAIDCGHSFCRSCLTQASLTSTACPKHPNVRLNPSHVIPNITVEDQVNVLSVYCGNAIINRGSSSSHDGRTPAFGRSAALLGNVSEHGCQMTGSSDEIKLHMQTCDFTPIPCPNSSQCGHVTKHLLHVHLASCSHTPCRYVPFGCPFRGTPEEVRFHSTTNCEHSADPLARQGRLLQSLMETAMELNGLIQDLQETAVAIEGKQDALLAQPRPSIARKGQIRHRHLRTPSSGVSRPDWSYTVPRDSQGDGTASDDEMDSWNEQYYQRLPAANHTIREATVEQHRAMTGELPTAAHDELKLPFNLQCIGTLGGHKGPIWCLACSEQLLFSASSDETTIHVWDLSGREPKRLCALSGHDAVIHCLHVDGQQQLYSGDALRQVKVWDLDTMECRLTFSAGNNIICGIASTGNLMVAASFASIAVWNIATRRLHKIVDSGLPHWVRALGTSPDGQLVLAATHNIVRGWS